MIEIEYEKRIARAAGACVSLLRQMPQVRRATAYLTPRLTVKATRQHRHDGRSHMETYVVTAGQPNYRERTFVRWLRRAERSYPVRRIQITYWPKKRKVA